jgi:hypothetical protein
MWTQARMVARLLLRRPIMAIAVLSMTVWWVSADALAQDSVPTGLGHSTSWSRESAAFDSAPDLVIGMAEHGAYAYYGALGLPRRRVVVLPSGDTKSLPVRSVTSINLGETGKPGPLLVSSLVAPTGVVRVGLAQPPVTFLRSLPNYLPRERWLADDGSVTDKVVAHPLLQLQFGGWSVPVLLGGAPVSP